MSELDVDYTIYLGIYLECFECMETLHDTEDCGDYRIYKCPKCGKKIRIIMNKKEQSI